MQSEGYVINHIRVTGNIGFTKVAIFNIDHKLQHYQSRTNVYKFSFFPCTVPDWNDLTTEQVSAMNLEQFKTLIM